MNTRRQFLITAPIGVLGVAAACRREQPAGWRVPDRRDAGRPADVRHGAARRAGRLRVHVRRSGEARAGHDDRCRARAWRRRAGARRWRRTSNGARGRARSRSTPSSRRRRCGIRCSPAARRQVRLVIAFVRSAGRPRPLPANDDGHRLCAGHPAFALDRADGAHRRSG